MYLNIADDVYRNQVEDLELSDEQKNDILVLAGDVSEERMEQVHDLIKDQAVNTANFNSSMRKLERELEKKINNEMEKQKNEKSKPGHLLTLSFTTSLSKNPVRVHFPR